MPQSPAGLALHADRALANTGTIGSMILLNDTLLTNAACTVDASLNTFATATPHGLTTGERVRTNTSAAGFGGSVPAPLSTTVDYFAQVQSATVFRLCATLADAVNATPVIVDITSVGSSVVVNAQLLLASDRKEVLLAHECSGNGYTRAAVTNIGAASIGVDGKARKPAVLWSVTATAGAIVYRHVCFLDGGTTVVGDATGTPSFFQSVGNPVTIAAGASETFSYVLGHEN